MVAITNSTGTLISQQRYLPFGQVRTDVASPNSPATDLAFTGQRNLDAQGNASLGLMDYHARMYDSLLARFIQPDTIIPSKSNPQNLNRFSYVNNDPIDATDPTGHSSCYGNSWDDGPRCLRDESSPLSRMVKQHEYQQRTKKDIVDWIKNFPFGGITLTPSDPSQSDTPLGTATYGCWKDGGCFVQGVNKLSGIINKIGQLINNPPHLGPPEPLGPPEDLDNPNADSIPDPDNGAGGINKKK